MNLSSLRKHFARNDARRRKRRCPAEVNLLEGRLLLATDLTAPVTTLQVVPNTLNSTGYYTSSPETVKLLASDPDSPDGISTFYNIDHTGFVPGNTFNLTDGNHTVQFYSVDASGNRELTQTQAINIDSTAPIVTVSANPSTLFPPNHKNVDVTISGHVADASGGVPTMVSYTINDEQNPHHPVTGTTAVDKNGNYSIIVPLQASRSGRDKDGRQYTIVVRATDEAGNSGSATTVVTVLHDRGNHNGSDSGSGSGSGTDSGGTQGTSNSGSNHRTGLERSHGHGSHGKGRGHGDRGSSPVMTPVVPPGGVNQGSNGGDNQGDNGNHGNGNHGDNGNHGNHGNGNNGNHGGNGQGNGKGHG